MSPVALYSLAALLAATGVSAQSSTYPATPLASKHFDYPSQIPYQADTDTGLVRGVQHGYNLCNSTTEGKDSLCQTSFLSALDDFCLWAPSKANSLIADTEGEEVAWCTKPGKGTRLIPNGALQGVQFMKTPDYVQVVGFIDQTQINIANGDTGGELDPHGADLRGNPMGGLVYSNAWSSDNSTYKQVIEWHNFMGGNQFCFKVCDPAGANAAKFCEHVYDRIGCAYNAPNAAKTGVFEKCEGENQDFPGVYTVSGQVMTYTQPPESEGAIATMPYQPRVPASSNCVQYTSAQLFAAIATVTPTGGASSSGSASRSGAASGSAAAASGSAKASSSSTPNSAPSSQSFAHILVGVVSGMVGVAGAVLLLS